LIFERKTHASKDHFFKGGEIEILFWEGCFSAISSGFLLFEQEEYESVLFNIFIDSTILKMQEEYLKKWRNLASNFSKKNSPFSEKQFITFYFSSKI